MYSPNYTGVIDIYKTDVMVTMEERVKEERLP
jgi:hypothetical protein